MKHEISFLSQINDLTSKKTFICPRRDAAINAASPNPLKLEKKKI